MHMRIQCNVIDKRIEKRESQANESSKLWPRFAVWQAKKYIFFFLLKHFGSFGQARNSVLVNTLRLTGTPIHT